MKVSDKDRALVRRKRELAQKHKEKEELPGASPLRKPKRRNRT